MFTIVFPTVVGVWSGFHWLWTINDLQRDIMPLINDGWLVIGSRASSGYTIWSWSAACFINSGILMFPTANLLGSNLCRGLVTRKCTPEKAEQSWKPKLETFAVGLQSWANVYSFLEPWEMWEKGGNLELRIYITMGLWPVLPDQVVSFTVLSLPLKGHYVLDFSRVMMSPLLASAYLRYISHVPMFDGVVFTRCQHLQWSMVASTRPTRSGVAWFYIAQGDGSWWLSNPFSIIHSSPRTIP